MLKLIGSIFPLRFNHFSQSFTDICHTQFIWIMHTQYFIYFVYFVINCTYLCIYDLHVLCACVASGTIEHELCCSNCDSTHLRKTCHHFLWGESVGIHIEHVETVGGSCHQGIEKKTAWEEWAILVFTLETQDLQ